MTKANYKDSDLVLVGFTRNEGNDFRRATESEQVEHADQLRLDEAAKKEAEETKFDLMTGRDY